MIHAANVRHYLASGEQVYLWNPYSLLQYAVDELVSSEAVYHLEASYPPLRQTRHAFGCAVALELLGYPTERQVLAVQPWTLTRHDPILSVYLTKLEDVHRSPTELAILEAVRAWRGSTVRPIEIFLHYSDRGVAALDPKYADFFAEFGDLVSDRGSLDCLSSAQISLSALSSIGLDLLSMEITHFVVTWEVKPGERHDGWRSRLSPTRSDVLRLGESPDDWLRQMRLNHPEPFDQVFSEGVCQ
jgi:hypothetical protein